ncbi:hypothetical protein NZL82_14035 [Sphingomonas sanguinis]|uniref:hypothetical protein n=1 Tax=Sphingomonas sp. LC-1 TaxID=3110957 RepID=UPI0021BA6444|nr:hypothetical protein [Sphingomonas sp. LC-1]MCT8002996.1 hypothetical protein [Sphingomonas sp. LC-1]
MILQNRKPRVPLRVDFLRGDYQANNGAFTSVMSMKEIEIAGPGGVSAGPDGKLYVSPAGQPRIVPGVGFLREPASKNLLFMRNAAPTSTEGWALLTGRPAGATITLVDDMQALRAAGIFDSLLTAGLMNGKVVRLYNPSADTEFAVPFFGANGGAFAISAYVRCPTGGGYITVTGGGGQTPIFTGAVWQRVGRLHTAGQQGRLVVRPQSEVLVILAQAEAARITSPIITYGQPVARGGDLFEVRGRNLFDQPHTILLEAEIAQQNNIERTMIQLGNASGEVMTVARTTDHALTGTLWNSYKRPCVPRLYGPGKVRMAHRIGARGQTIAAAGLCAHAPFLPPPERLDRLSVGARLDGTLPMSGWIRSIEIIGEVGDDDLEALVANDNDAFLPEARRYVSPNGDDSADGRTPATAWKTLAKAGDITQFWPGTHIFLERGGTWNETLLTANRATYRPYGSGALPKIGVGQTYALDENAANDFRLQQIHITGAKSRGVNCYGASGVMIVDCEVSGNGSLTDDNAIGIAIRGNTRRAESELLAKPAAVNVTEYSTSEAALTGTFVARCIKAGTGSQMQWQVFRPDGSLITITQADGTVIRVLTGGTRFSGGGIVLNLSGTGAVGDEVKVRAKPFSEIALPGNALAEDVLIERCHIHDNIGKAAGDALYIEGVGGLCLVIGNLIPPPRGVAADCIQIGRNNRFYVANPAHAIVRNNRVAAFTGGGKGAIVVLSESCLIEGNHIRGHNFCISLNPLTFAVVRWNYCYEANLYNYSWGIGVGSDFDCYDLAIYENVIVGCNRAVTFSGNGNSTFTLEGRVVRFQYRSRVAVNDNDVQDCPVGVFIDRPTGGRVQFNRFKNVPLQIDRRTQALPPGDAELRISHNQAA